MKKLIGSGSVVVAIGIADSIIFRDSDIGIITGFALVVLGATFIFIGIRKRK